MRLIVLLTRDKRDYYDDLKQDNSLDSALKLDNI